MFDFNSDVYYYLDCLSSLMGTFGKIDGINCELDFKRDTLNYEEGDFGMMYDEDYVYVTGGTHSVAYRVAREMYLRRMHEREEILKMVRENPSYFKNFDYTWRDDKQVAIEAILMNAMLLEYVSEDLKRDEEVVKFALNSDVSAIKFAGNNIKDSDSIMCELISKNGLLLEYASSRIKKDKDVCLRAVMNDGKAISYVDDELKGDRDIVLSAIRQNGALILKVDKKYLSDKEAVITAVSQKSKAYLLMFVDRKFLDDVDVVLSAYIYDKNVFKYASESVKDQIRVILLKSAVDSLFVSKGKIETNNVRVKRL